MGNFIRVPAPFSGALGAGAYYTLAGLDPAAAAVVTIQDAANQTTLGVKKFRGGTQADIRLARYAMQLSHVRPVAAGDDCHGTSALAGDTRKSVSLQVIHDGVAPPAATLVLSAIDPDHYKPMTDMPLAREMDMDGYDELSLILPSGEATATARFTTWPGGAGSSPVGGPGGTPGLSGDAGESPDGSEALELDLGSVAGPCVATLGINMADLVRRIGDTGSQVEEFAAMEVIIDFAGGSVEAGGQAEVGGQGETAGGPEAIVLHYSLTGEMGRGVKLCWVNRYGAIDYFTFSALARGVTVTKGADFSRTTTTLTIVSQYQPQAVIDALSGVCSSSRVWMVGQAGEHHPAKVVTHELSFSQQGPNNLKITIQR